MIRTGFPGCIDGIDCIHVAILAPRIEEHKSFHSKSVQLICDYKMEILNVNARYPGSTHDAFIWRASAIKRLMEGNYAAVQKNTWLLGDSVYSQQPWLMTVVQDALPHQRHCIIHTIV